MRRNGDVPRLQSIGPSSGLALVMDVEAFRPFFFETGISLRGSQRHRAGLRWGDEGLGARVSYTFRRDADDDFWGIGGDTPVDQHSDFLRDKQEAGIWGHGRPLDFLTVEAGFAWEDNRVDRGFDGGIPESRTSSTPTTWSGSGSGSRWDAWTWAPPWTSRTGSGSDSAGFGSGWAPRCSGVWTARRPTSTGWTTRSSATCR